MITATYKIFHYSEMDGLAKILFDQIGPEDGTLMEWKVQEASTDDINNFLTNYGCKDGEVVLIKSDY